MTDLLSVDSQLGIACQHIEKNFIDQPVPVHAVLCGRLVGGPAVLCGRIVGGPPVLLTAW